MQKRERLEKAMAGESIDRVPVSLWRHWPGDDQRAADLARSLLDYQRQFDWDLLTIIPSSTFQMTNYGLQDAWAGDTRGDRTITRHLIQRSLDWTDLRPQEAMRGDTGKQLACLNILQTAFQDDPIPLIHAVYSPLTQAAKLAGEDLLRRHMRSQPDRLRTGLNTLTESTLRFVEALRRTSISGILYIVDQACLTRLTEAEYVSFGRPYDEKILEVNAGRWWLNILHAGGSSPMLQQLGSLHVQAVNWCDQSSAISLDGGWRATNKAVCGGLDTTTHIRFGTPTSVKQAAREALDITGGKRFILGAGNPMDLTSPVSNIRAAREAVENIMI